MRISFLLRGGNSSKPQLPSITESNTDLARPLSSAKCVPTASTRVAVTLLVEVVALPDRVSILTVSAAADVSTSAESDKLLAVDVTPTSVLLVSASALLSHRRVRTESADKFPVTATGVVTMVAECDTVAMVTAAVTGIVRAESLSPADTGVTSDAAKTHTSFCIDSAPDFAMATVLSTCVVAVLTQLDDVPRVTAAVTTGVSMATDAAAVMYNFVGCA